MPFTHEQIQRLRHRHRGYILTLATEVLLILALPFSQSHAWLLSLLLIGLAVVLITTVTRYSPWSAPGPCCTGSVAWRSPWRCCGIWPWPLIHPWGASSRCPM